MPSTVNKACLKRLQKEHLDLRRPSSDLAGLLLEPNESDMTSWKGWIPGPEGTPYEGGWWEVSMNVPSDYPFKPPQCKFVTKIYHCNVNHEGGICLDILKGQWSPALSLHKVLLSISALLTCPNPDDPLVGNIATLYKRDRKMHDATAKHETMKYAMTVPPGMKSSVKNSTASKPVPSAPSKPDNDNNNNNTGSTSFISRLFTGSGTSISNSSSAATAIDLEPSVTSTAVSTTTSSGRPIAGTNRVASSSSARSTNGTGTGNARNQAVEIDDSDEEEDERSGQAGRRIKRRINGDGVGVSGNGPNGRITTAAPASRTETIEID